MIIENGVLLKVTEEDIIDGKFEIPEGVTSIAERAFGNCKSLKEIIIPEGVTEIGDRAFTHCSSLISIVIPKGVKKMGKIDHCSSLISISFPEGITEIGSISSCSSLASITIPKGIKKMGKIDRCSSLISITISEEVTEIESHTFGGCTSLTSITIPKGVTKIGDYAFFECSSLEKVEILSDDLLVQLNAFEDCFNLKDPKIPEDAIEGKLKFQKGGYIAIYKDTNGEVKTSINTYSIEELIKRGKIDSSLSKEEQEKIYNEYKNELEKTSRIYRDMPLKYSQNFNISTAIEYVEKIRKILGNEEVEDIFRLPQEVDLKNINSNILSVYEKRYNMKGSIPITVDILENISGVVGKSERMKLFKEINSLLENVDKNISFEELMKECGKRAGIEINEEVVGKIKGRVIQKEYTRKEEDIQEAIEREVRTNGIDHRGVVSGLIEKVIKVNELKEGGIEDIEEILQRELRKEKEDGSMYYEGIANEQMQDRIRGIIAKVYENNREIVGKKVSEKLSETKEEIGDKWIGKILKATSKKDLDNMTKEEYEEMLFKLKEQGIDTRKIEEAVGEGILVLKPGINKENAIEVLVREEYPQILTYEKAEMMFSAMREPYSESFATWFKDNREEIMKRPEIYTILAEVHNRFEDKILQDMVTRTRLEQGLLDVSTVIGIYEDTLDKLEAKEGNKELAYKAQLVGMSQERYEGVEEIFEVTKKRERSYIPTVEEQTKHYRGRILRADDVMNVLAGDATNCCQKVGDVGENSARHGAMENTGRIFVVEELDKKGKPVKMVAQSWVWRNKDRMCFDNIEVPVSEQDVLRDGQRQEDISRQEEILQIYKECAKKAITKDEKLFKKLLKEGKITEEQYEELVLKDVTVGTGYNDLGILKERGLEEVEEKYMMSPNVSNNTKYNEEYNYGKPWIDSGVDDGWQLYLAKNEEHRREKIGKYEIDEIPLEEMYRNKREVMRLKGKEVSTAVKTIKEIEEVVFRGEQQMLENAKTHRDIAQIYGMEEDKIQIYVSREKDWYMIFEEGEEEIYIADIRAVNGVNTQGNNKTENLRQSVEVMESVYGVMLESGEKGKSIRLNATDDTSYLNIQNMAEKGFIEIVERESRQWEDEEKIGMHDMVITVDTEKMKEELDRISKYKKRLDDRNDR